MNDANKKTQRVMTRIGVWSPGQICRNGGEIVNWKDDDGRAKCPICQNIVFSSQGYHDIPCPDPSDPAIKWAMLEGLLKRARTALIDAIDAITALSED